MYVEIAASVVTTLVITRVYTSFKEHLRWNRTLKRKCRNIANTGIYILNVSSLKRGGYDIEYYPDPEEIVVEIGSSEL